MDNMSTILSRAFLFQVLVISESELYKTIELGSIEIQYESYIVVWKLIAARFDYSYSLANQNFVYCKSLKFCEFRI